MLVHATKVDPKAGREVTQRDEGKEDENEGLVLLDSLLSTYRVFLDDEVHGVKCVTESQQPDETEVLGPIEATKTKCTNCTDERNKIGNEPGR